MGGGPTTSFTVQGAVADVTTFDPQALQALTPHTRTVTHSAGGTQVTDTYTGGLLTTLQKLTYQYDKNSNPTSITNERNETSSFTYDTLNRLTREAHQGTGAKTLIYTYDAAGNRKTLSDGTTSTNYTYDAAERMTAAGR